MTNLNTRGSTYTKKKLHIFSTSLGKLLKAAMAFPKIVYPGFLYYSQTRGMGKKDC